MAGNRSAETREAHRVYWEKLTCLHRETVSLILAIGNENGEHGAQGAYQICELLGAHKVRAAIDQARFLSNYSEDHSQCFDRICNLIENYQDTLPESEKQVVAIVYNLCGTDHIQEILHEKIPQVCSNAMIFLSGRRNGFLIERMEMTLVVVTKAMETGAK